MAAKASNASPAVPPPWSVDEAVLPSSPDRMPLTAGDAPKDRKSSCCRFTLPQRPQSPRRTSNSRKIRVSPHERSRTRRCISHAGTPRRARVPPIDYRDGFSACLTSKEETDITTIIQRRPQHPRRTGRDQSEQLVAIRRN